MDIYLTNLKTGDRLRFPMLPTEVSIRTANRFADYAILSIGEVRLPNGTALDSVSWSGTLPGRKRVGSGAPYIFDWQDPKAIYRWIDRLKAQHGMPVKARLLITESPINCDVYLSDFTGTPAGGYGDIRYSISFIQAKDIRVRKSGQQAKQDRQASTAAAPSRPSPPAAKTYTVKKGDSLWSIAQKMGLGGANYSQLYQANQSVVDAHNGGPNMIWPGDVLTIPG